MIYKSQRLLMVDFLTRCRISLLVAETYTKSYGSLYPRVDEMMVKKFASTCLIIGLTLSVGCSSQLELVSRLREAEANEILVVLNTKKITGQKLATTVNNKTTFSINVSSNKFNDAVKLLVINRLPRELSPGLEQVYPPGSAGLIPTKTEERARYAMAVQGEVENLIQILPGIVRARVALVMPDTAALRSLSAKPLAASASVAVVYTPLSNGNPPIQASGLKSLVASAVEDLGPEDVTVVMTPNIPPRLINDSTKLQASAANVTARDIPTTTSQIEESNSSSVPGYGEPTLNEAIESSALQKAMSKDNLLIWLFAVLAVIGLAVGILGMVRVLALRSKLRAVQEGYESKAQSPRSAQLPEDEGSDDDLSQSNS